MEKFLILEGETNSLSLIELFELISKILDLDILNLKNFQGE